MPGADRGPLGPELEERLRGELDAVQPRFSAPRYLAHGRRPVAWRVAPAAFVAAILGIAGLSAYAGSPNPRVWTEHVFAVIGVSPESTNHQRSQGPSTVSPKPTPTERESPEPNESPEPRESPEPNESPKPSGGESGSGDGGTGDGGTSDGGTSGGGTSDGGTSDGGTSDGGSDGSGLSGDGR